MKHKRVIKIALCPSLFFSLILIFYIFFNLKSKPYHLLSSSNNYITLNKTPQTQTKFSVLIGILTRPDNYNRRHFLRLVYGIQKSSVPHIDIKFIFCNLTKPEQKMLISLEILRFDDIIILNCKENMNNGKTYTYFSSVPKILPKHYTYVMKADDDSYIRLEQLFSSLMLLPRHDLYYGFVIPCDSKNPYVDYMSGMGFLLSWDIVEWIAESEIPANSTEGPEDKLVGKWLKIGKKGMNRFSDKPGMYDYPGTNGKCSHQLIPETVVVHRLKRWDQWYHVLQFFNVTQQLKQSNLYHF
ncbi:hydroxyproline O-galactosyltransferase GALT3-like [Mercurialis annua]|uniref:hydroxyproline O-galactosyltransferase GALT3-like n=1 Tax=Mercurialis annua TaxID=3986 RepID=UPI00216102B4|nr:hydroxyproline O-galactosyltransferase GALT3-like [Mercurialis annua]